MSNSLRGPLSLLATLLLSWSAAAADVVTDWRKSATVEEKVEHLTRVVPGASTIMLQMGTRYKNLYWAANKGLWDFAGYQVEEMEELVNTLMITRPKRAATARAFLRDAFASFPEAIAARNWSRFEQAFENMRARCMTCHIQNDHAYIRLPAAPEHGNSPVLNVK